MLMVVAAGCSSEEYASSTAEGKSAEDKATEDKPKEEKKEEAKLEIIDSTGGSWKDSIDSVWVHSAAIFKNTGSVAVEIGESQLNLKAQDDSILGTATMIYAVPSVVQPGETAFIGESSLIEGATDPAQYKETTYNFGFNKTDSKGNILEVSGVKGIKGDEYTPYKVTGVVKNTTDAKQDDIRLAAALLDESGKLLGVFTGSVDVGVNPEGEAGFDLSYPEIPKEVADKIAKVEVKSYAWNW